MNFIRFLFFSIIVILLGFSTGELHSSPLNNSFVRASENGVPTNDNVFLPITSPPFMGILMDGYKSEMLVIKLTQPKILIADVLRTFDKSRMAPVDFANYQKTLGDLEVKFQKQFSDLLSLFAELTPSTRKLEDNYSNGQVVDITHITNRRTKRSPWRFLISLFRLARPASRGLATIGRAGSVVGKASRYGRFFKTLGRFSTAMAVVALPFEVANAFGVFDYQYEVIKEKLNALENSQNESLALMGNITLFSSNLNDYITDVRSEFIQLVSDVSTMEEFTMSAHTLLSSYISTLQLSLLLAQQSYLTPSLLSFDNQRDWIISKLPRRLSRYIGTITPTLPVKLVGIDEQQGNLIFTIETPEITSEAEELDFIKWEPNFYHKGLCYSSPRPYLYLAYPHHTESRIIKPILIDPQSCLDKGFLICESDSILDEIPEIKLDKVCTKKYQQKGGYRSKRDTSFYNDALTTSFNLTPLVERTELATNRYELNRLDKPQSSSRNPDLFVPIN